MTDGEWIGLWPKAGGGAFGDALEMGETTAGRVSPACLSDGA
jgi:hypothetical protein